jgi:hypothetical protein
MKLVKRCRGGVTISMIMAIGREGGEIKSEKKRAPTTKSNWSVTGRDAPGGRLSLRFMKE